MVLPLLVGIGAFLGSLLTYGMAMALIVHLVVRLIRSGYTGLEFGKNVLVMMIVSLATTAAHLIQIALWAVALLLSGEISAEAMAAEAMAMAMAMAMAARPKRELRGGTGSVGGQLFSMRGCADEEQVGPEATGSVP
jgi:hypothetical protein